MSEIRNRLLATENLDPKAQSLLLRYFIVDSTRLVAFNISSMFVILFLLDTLESTEVAVLFAVNFLILTLIDYPTGVFGDIIGHKKVMMLAYFFYIISFVLLVFSDTFIPLLFYSACAAIGASQESGALESWFDNNYRVQTQNTDPERQIYKSFQARKSILFLFLFGLSIFTCGMIAQDLSRKLLFGVSLFLTIIVL
jgi:MFS family permease